jgi:uncharacterized iron-regulated protein
MFKSLVVLAVSSMMATSAVAQAQPADAAAAKPQTVKKRVCYAAEEDSYSRLGSRKICKTIEVPVQATSSNGGQAAQTAPAPAPSGGTSNR